MGKFYFDDKHKWFQHQIERSHKKLMCEDGGFAVAAEVVDELRFFHRDENCPVVKHVRISDHGLSQLAVLSANGFVGLLDDSSSQVMRAFFATNPHFHNSCPAIVVRREEFTGAYILKLGIK